MSSNRTADERREKQYLSTEDKLHRVPPSHARPVADHPFPAISHHIRHAEPSLVVSNRTQPSLPTPTRTRAPRSISRALLPTLTHAARTATLCRHRPHSAATDALSIDLAQQPQRGGPQPNAHARGDHASPPCSPYHTPCSHEALGRWLQISQKLHKLRNNSLNL